MRQPKSKYTPYGVMRRLPANTNLRAALPSEKPASSDLTSHFSGMWPSLKPEATVDERYRPVQSQSTTRSDRDNEDVSGSHERGVSWKDLLQRIEKTREKSYPAMPPVYLSKRDVLAAGRQSREQPRHVDDAYHDRIFDSQTESRKHSLQLQEELKELNNAADALKWMQNRLFSTSENSLVSKIVKPAASQTKELYRLYADLLVDLTNLLRIHAPHSASIPLALARSHSPTSYMYGCTASLYAANMRVRWENFGDIQGCLEIMQEMERAAVHYNAQIMDYVKNMSIAVMADRLRAQQDAHVERAEESQAPVIPTSEITDVSTTSSIQEQPTSAKSHSTEKSVDSRLFFSGAQRRALRDIERLVVEDRRRYAEGRAREDNLQDNITFRSNVSRFASHEEIAMAEQEAGNTSEVNALIDSYGKAVRLPSDGREQQPARHQPLPPRRNDIRQRQSRSSGGSPQQEKQIDVLEEAIAQAGG
jgi:hypothetical protein